MSEPKKTKFVLCPESWVSSLILVRLQNSEAKLRNTVKPYQEEGSKKEQVRQMFDRIAPGYDALNRVLSLGIDRSWRKRAIRLLEQAAAREVLDVATGTADLALAIARKLPEAEVTGIDIAGEMLAVGRKKAKRNALNNRVDLQLGDAENLTFADNTFDAVTVAFGVRNFENLEKGLIEMHRVLRPGGQVVILEFSKPRSFPFKQVFQFYFKNILPLIGKLVSRDASAYGYLYRSVQAFPEGEAFMNILSKTGFKSGKCIPLTLGVCTIYQAFK